MARLAVVALIFGLFAVTYAAPGLVGRGANGAGVLDGEDVGFPSSSGLGGINGRGSGLVILNSRGGSGSPHHRAARSTTYWSSSSSSASASASASGPGASTSVSASSSSNSHGSSASASASASSG